MLKIRQLLANNAAWAERMLKANPDFFNQLVAQQSPEYLWIGCSDSRVPANQVVGMAPGELFVHRNVANQVIQTDFNCLSVVQYAVETLQVKHILVVGHYGCGGVKAATESCSHGLVDHWLFGIKDIYREYHQELEAIGDSRARLDRLCELNVIEQVRNLAKTTIIQQAWDRGQELAIHGWVYSIEDGLVRDMEVTVRDRASLERIYHFNE
ncbi:MULTISPECIES: carbonate dehydratase [Idiomarinaceae]|uniref:Carbonic anhydrase n=3 Tax=Pseudidiomarina TaxID=2800384 RepID=A0A368UPG8_9GAMM|nr:MULTISPECIES: carbonate dehydratase [Idiomarinaceae]MDT7525512.1 carbonate dehydratase [Pseudidiomarina sp. GXY010]MRJ42294.1 carbonate dehydratase [Idiomarina sp. FeN1]NCU57419.1 carbonate dehydratase [Idiomarina sp. FenA--70]NCU60605.1 carbonate dehydratase [Idiomarina sp. FenBw--71]PWW05431.1 carbonic anhydrase [Pseudidiomarina maritima]